MTPRLLYVFDPLCAWSYAAAPLLRAIRTRFEDSLQLEFQPGVLFRPAVRLAPDSCARILKDDRRIAELTGMPFGAAYRARLQQSPGPLMDSAPPAAAVLATVEIAPQHALAMLEAIQYAHYVAGQDIGDERTLRQCALALGLVEIDFALALRRALDTLPARAAKARAILQAAGDHGFPTFILKIGGRLIRVDHADAYARPALLTERLDSLLHTYARVRLTAPIEAGRRVLASAAHADAHP